MWQRIRQWWRASGDLAQLQGVSNRMLEDMGLKREGLRNRVMARPDQPNGGRAVTERKATAGATETRLASAKPC